MNQKSKIMIGAVAVPLICLLTIYIYLGVYPFGDRSLLSYDMSQQYVEFYSYLSSFFEGKNGWGFSFAQSLGGDTVGLFTYYLISPFNALFWILNGNLPLAVSVVTVLKTVSCGLTMSVYLNEQKENWGTILFSTAYALMAYTVLYASNLMWLDGVIALPLVMLGIQRCIERCKISALYVVALCYCLVTNFYIGYMVCIMSVLYMGYELFKKKRPCARKCFGRFVISSILAGGISAVILIPAACAMLGTKAGFDIHTILNTDIAYSFKDCIIKWYGGSWSAQEMVLGAPNVYCSAFIVVCAIAFFFNRKIGIRKKIMAGIMIAILVLSSMSSMLNLVWHVFNAPNCYPGRFSFVISFFVIVLAYEDFCAKGKRWGITEAEAGVGYLFLAVVLKDEELINIKMIVVDVFLALLILGGAKLLYKRRVCLEVSSKTFGRERMKPAYKLLTCLIMILCLMVDLGMHQTTVMKQIGAESVQEFQDYFQRTGEAVDWVKNKDDSLYRMEKTFVRNNNEYNDSYMFDYAGISSFTSTTKSDVMSFCGRLGYRYNWLKIIYGGGSSLFVDSFLGVKYVLSEEERPELNLLNQLGDVYVYENPYALGLGISSVSQEAVCTQLSNDNTFEVQNVLFNNLTGIETPVLEEMADVSYDYNNLREENGILVKEDSSMEGSVTYTVTSSRTGYVYYRLSGTVDALEKVYVNEEELVEYYAQSEWNVFSKYVKAGETFDVTVRMEAGNCNLKPLKFYYENMDVLEEGIQMLQQNSIQVERDGHYAVKANVENSAENGYMVFTIPYDSSWSCYVDGEKTEIQEAWGCLMAIKTGVGSHEIKLVYRIKGLNAGICMSVVSLAVSVFIFRGRRKNTRIVKG